MVAIDLVYLFSVQERKAARKLFKSASGQLMVDEATKVHASASTVLLADAGPANVTRP